MSPRFFVIFACVLLLPFVAEAAGAPRTFRELVVDIVTILSDATATLLALAVVIFIWNIASNMTKLSTEGMKAYKTIIVWGTLILFVMVSIWGILGLLRNTLFQGDQVRSINTSIEFSPLSSEKYTSSV